MNPGQLTDDGRKRKSTVTQQPTSQKRRGPDAAPVSSQIIVEEDSVVVGQQENTRASTSHEAPSSDTGFSADKFITMPPVMLEGDTLGKKHQHFNKLVEDAIANTHYKLNKISADDRDIDNLLKIHIASKTRNVDYIIEVLKSDDMLYAATAIKKSTWLITEQQYAHIINPEYLHTQLLPSMNTKTFNKLMLHIRLNMKDESRVETFYKYLKETDDGYKWLANCSFSCIENAISDRHHSIPTKFYKRLCRRSAQFIAYFRKVGCGKETIIFLLRSHTADVIKALDQSNLDYCPELGKKKTEVLMKKCPNKIIDDFKNYATGLDLSVVAKYLNKKEIKTFLYNQARTQYATNHFNFDNLGHFVKNMPEEERFDFVRKTFIDTTELAAFYPNYILSTNLKLKSYQWYEFAPFNEALAAFKILINEENSSSKRCDMLSILITCARSNPQHIKTLLIFFIDRHTVEPLTFKILFVNNLLSQISAHETDVETWNLLDQLFHIIGVYSESDNNVQMCLETIVVFKVLHEEPVPKIVEHKITFSTFEKIQRKLNPVQNDKLLTYLLNSALAKVKNENIASEFDFSETVIKLKNVLILLRVWNKDISKYSFVLWKVQELNKAKQRNMWKTDLSDLYNVKKSWRKHMFEESLSLCLCEETCLNALKHKPQLLTIHDTEINMLRNNDAISLRRLLVKLRVFWPDSLAQQWTDSYLRNLKKTTGQKATITGLFTLFPQNQVIDMAKKYMPHDIKVNWGKADQMEISIRKNIAKHLHLARPLIPLDVILSYAKGDYLQYTLPSLNALLKNLNKTEARNILTKLLDAPVSLQKYGLNLAVSILQSEDLKSLFLNVWKTLKNLTVRSVIFTHIFDQMCNANNLTDQKYLWETLSTFIDNLKSNENAEIYAKFYNVQNVPTSIRAEFYMKSYEFLTSLPVRVDCKIYAENLMEYAPKIMVYLDEDFVVNKMLSPAVAKFCSHESEVLNVFACYVLCGNSEEDQIQRFRKVVEPALDEVFQFWGSTRSGNYYNRDKFNKFLSSLSWNFRVYYLSKKTLPVRLFTEIRTKIEKELPLLENYVLYTSWKLVTEYVKIMHELKLCQMIVTSDILTLNYNSRWMSYDMEDVWKNIHFKVSPLLGPVIVKCLKEDTEHYNIPTIYCLFTEAFQKIFDQLLSLHDKEVFVLETLQYMLHDLDFIPSYFLVSKLTLKHNNIRKYKIRSEIRKKLESHPSTLVQMHYYNDFQNLAEDQNS